MAYNPPAEHEALCRRCGRCCYEKLIMGNHVFTTRKPCPHLDVQTNLCTVYERRLEVNPRCLTISQGIQLGVFPADCPYVRGLRDYTPAEEGWLEDETVRKIERGQIRTCEEVREEMRRSANSQCEKGKPVKEALRAPRGR